MTWLKARHKACAAAWEEERPASTIPTATSPEIPIKTAPADDLHSFVTVMSIHVPEQNLFLFWFSTAISGVRYIDLRPIACGKLVHKPAAS
jgi:hypothetical protein